MSPAYLENYRQQMDGARSGAQNQQQQQGGQDDPRSSIIQGVLESFQQIAVQVPVPNVTAPYGQPWTSSDGSALRRTQANVKIPYWNNKYVVEVGGEKLTPPAGFDPTERTRVLSTLGIGAQSAVAVAKGSPSEIGQVIQQAIDRDLVPKPGFAPVSDEAYWAGAWKPQIESWLVRVGIGVDCSGFVYQALQAVKGGTGAQTTGQAGQGNGILDIYPNDSSGRTIASDDEMGSTGAAVTPPDGLQPGDVMYISNHIRIIMSVNRERAAEGVTEFRTAESTADGRYQPGGATNGPRLHDWKYDQGTLYHRYENNRQWVASNETPVYRRHLAAPAEQPAQRKAGATATGGSGGDSGRGQLPSRTRAGMERAFNTDFSGVQVFEGGQSEKVGALAYTQGTDVHFAPGQYRPGTPEGDRLIGHELAHVVQQREGRVSTPQGKGAPVVTDESLEREADVLGDRAVAGEVARAPQDGDGGERGGATGRSSGGAVQRQDDEAQEEIYNDLKRNSKSPEVATVQGVLVRMLYLKRENANTDNRNNSGAPFYGAYTTEAVGKFQDAEGVAPTVHPERRGSVTVATWNKLQEANAGVAASDARAGQYGQDAVAAANRFWTEGANGLPLDRRHHQNVNDTLGAAGVDAGTSPYTADEEGNVGRTTVGDGDEVNWCGMFVTMAWREAGFGEGGSSLNQSLLSTTNVREFFNYISTSRNPQYIIVGRNYDEVKQYHQQRRAPRRWLDGAAVAAELAAGRRDFVQPGDIVTFGAGDGEHITMFDHWNGELMVTVEGNAYGLRGSSASEDVGGNEGVVKNERTLTPNRDGSGTQSSHTSGIGGTNTIIHGVGRPSPVDFERHGYAFNEEDAKKAAAQSGGGGGRGVHGAHPTAQ